jgi:hypothetical protein
MRPHLNLLFYLNDNEVAGGVSEKEPWSVVEEVSGHSSLSRAGPHAISTAMPTLGDITNKVARSTPLLALRCHHTPALALAVHSSREGHLSSVRPLVSFWSVEVSAESRGVVCLSDVFATRPVLVDISHVVLIYRNVTRKGFKADDAITLHHTCHGPVQHQNRHWSVLACAAVALGGVLPVPTDPTNAHEHFLKVDVFLAWEAPFRRWGLGQQQPMFIGTQSMYPHLPVSTGSSIREKVTLCLPLQLPLVINSSSSSSCRVSTLTFSGPCSVEH